jgi:hypothetical protein
MDTSSQRVLMRGDMQDLAAINTAGVVHQVQQGTGGQIVLAFQLIWRKYERTPELGFYGEGTRCVAPKTLGKKVLYSKGQPEMSWYVKISLCFTLQTHLVLSPSGMIGQL